MEGSNTNNVGVIRAYGEAEHQTLMKGSSLKDLKILPVMGVSRSGQNTVIVQQLLNAMSTSRQ